MKNSKKRKNSVSAVYVLAMNETNGQMAGINETMLESKVAVFKKEVRDAKVSLRLMTGVFTGQCHLLASAAVPAPGRAVRAVEGEVGWVTIFVRVILVAEYHGCSIMSKRDTSHVPQRGSSSLAKIGPARAELFNAK